MTNQIARRLSLVMLACFVASTSGCASMLTARKAELPLENQTAKETYSVQIDSSYAKDALKVGELKPGMTVQQALDEMGLTKQYKAAEITLMRPVADKGQVLKMACEFQPGKPLIKFEQDYALHKGDRILIQPKKNFLEKLIDN
jgi:hypothetical protein